VKTGIADLTEYRHAYRYSLQFKQTDLFLLQQYCRIMAHFLKSIVGKLRVDLIDSVSLAIPPESCERWQSVS
jgi:hypothetical protein